jgi:PleD family two-component response regulator
VEFFFTLPIAAEHLCKTPTRLPRHSSEITKSLQVLAEPIDDRKSIDRNERNLEHNINEAKEQLGRPLSILIIDDEDFYRSAVCSYLSRTPELAQAINVTQATSSSEALLATNTASFDLVITDVDMGNESLDGFELVKELRLKAIRTMICVHSNRIVG